MYADFKKFLVEKCEKVLKITFNNPAKKNTLSVDAYEEIGKVLRVAAKDETITLVVFTGVGDFFTAGNDMSIKPNDDTDMETRINRMNIVFREMVIAFIECPKILIALVNGPAIGVGATLSALCDFVWCNEQAYFHTPFTKLGLLAEACSSYLFPLILGRSRASEMLLFSEKLSAKEAFEHGFVSRMYNTKSDLSSVVWPKIQEWSELPPVSLEANKRVIRLPEKRALYEALSLELEELSERIRSEEFMNALLAFSMRKQKSSKL